MNLETIATIVTSFLTVLGWGEKRMSDLKQTMKEEIVLRTKQLEDDKQELKDHIIRLENKLDTLIQLQLRGNPNDRPNRSN